MSTKQWYVLALCSGLLAGFSGPLSVAGEPSCSQAIPAALRVLTPSEDEILTDREAHAIRGAALFFANQGTLVSFEGTSRVEDGEFVIAGVAGGKTVTLTAGPSRFSFSTYGVAVHAGSVPNQGILVTQTGAFDGALIFDGDFSSIEIVALPDMFGVDFQ